MPPLEFDKSTPPESGRPALGSDWRDYLSILLERMWLVVTVFVLFALGTFVHLKRQIPVYQSFSRIMIEDRPSVAVNIQDFLNANKNSAENYNTHIKTLYGRDMVAEALRHPQLSKEKDFVPASASEEAKVDVALGYMKIVPVPQSRLIDIVVEHPNPALAALFANVLAETYISQDVARRVRQSDMAQGFFEKQVQSSREKLENGRRRLAEYRKQHNAVSLEQSQDVVISTLKARSSALADVKNTRLLLETSSASVTSAGGQVETLYNIPEIAQDASVVQARGALDKARGDLKLLADRYGPKHPEMIDAGNREQLLVKAFEESVRSAAALLQARYQAAVSQEKALLAALREQEQVAMDLDLKLVEYDRIKREVEADEKFYDSMLSRMKETSASSQADLSRISIVEKARPSKVPARPSVRKTVAMGLLLGLFFGVSSALTAHAADNRLRRVDEAERYLGKPVLASIPHISTGDKAERSRVSEHSPASIAAEAFRTLRACIALQPAGRDARVLMVTSTGISDGKSLVSANLATVLAQDGRKTLLVDADLRRPTIHRTYALPEGRETPGLSNILKVGMPWRDAVHATAVPGLDVMPSGPIPDNPAELLGSPVMGNLVKELRGHYDRIIVDAPPAIGVSDPLVLLSRVEAVVFVVHFGKTSRHAARLAIQQMEAAGTPVLGTVVDNIHVRFGGSYNYYYYHRHSGYQYESKDTVAGKRPD